MTEATLFLPGLSPVGGKTITATFDGGKLSSNGGVLILREIERKLGLAAVLSRHIPDDRDRMRITHSYSDMTRARMFAIASGHEDCDDLDVLRPGKRPSGEEVEQILRHVIGRIRRNWPAVEIMVRGDSHFATPEVMDLLEEKRCGYIFGLSTNPRLTEIGRPWSEDVATGRALSKTEKMRRFFQTSYAAASWSKPRKVVARVEASEQGSDIRFIVTNLPGRAKVLYEKVYCARGRMENLIKDMKLYTRSDRTSCHRWEANQFRLFLHMGAYWLLHELRSAAPKRSIWRTATFETIRCTLPASRWRCPQAIRMFKP